MDQVQGKLILEDIRQAQQICGMADEHLRMIEKHTGAGLVVRGQEILLSGSSKEQAAARIIIEHLLALTKKKDINKSDVQYALTLGGERKKEEIMGFCSFFLLLQI